MKVKIHGISFKPCEAISMGELWTGLENFSRQQIVDLKTYLDEDSETLPKSLATKTLVLVADQGEYKAGVLIKIRDAKSMFSVSGEDGKLQIVKKDFDPGEKQTELNFFLIRKDSGKGLYSYYHHSTHMNSFAKALAAVHFAINRRYRAELNRKVKEKEMKEKEAKEARTKLKPFEYSIICRPEGTKQLIKRLDEIKKVNLSFEDWESQADDDTKALVQHAKTAGISMNFESGSPLAQIKNTLVSLLSKGGLKKMRVEGTDPDGLGQIINLEDNLEAFATEDYDAFASHVSELDLTNLDASWKKSKALKWLQDCAESDGIKPRLK